MNEISPPKQHSDMSLPISNPLSTNLLTLRIPTELWVFIFSELDYTTLRLNISPVCRHFHSILHPFSAGGTHLDHILYRDVPTSNNTDRPLPFTIIHIHHLLYDLVFHYKDSPPAYSISSTHSPAYLNDTLKRFHLDQLPFMHDNATNPAVKTMEMIVTLGTDTQSFVLRREGEKGVSVKQVCEVLMGRLQGYKPFRFTRWDFEVAYEGIAEAHTEGGVCKCEVTMRMAPYQRRRGRRMI